MSGRTQRLRLWGVPCTPLGEDITAFERRLMEWDLVEDTANLRVVKDVRWFYDDAARVLCGGLNLYATEESQRRLFWADFTDARMIEFYQGDTLTIQAGDIDVETPGTAWNYQFLHEIAGQLAAWERDVNA